MGRTLAHMLGGRRAYPGLASLDVSVIGMNFQPMPELSWAWGYPAVWVVGVLVAGGMAGMFKRRG